MRKYFYVDTENLGYAEWLPHFEGVTKQDTIILMVSEKSGRVPIMEVANTLVPLFKECIVKRINIQTGEQNAMDFCLVATLGQHVQRAPKSKHILLSQDKGYDAVVKMFNEQGISVSRFGSYQNIVEIRRDLYKGMSVKDMPLEFQRKWEARKKALELQKKKMSKVDYDRLLQVELKKLQDSFYVQEEMCNV